RALQKSMSKPTKSPDSSTYPKPGRLWFTPQRSSPRSLIAFTTLCENAALRSVRSDKITTVLMDRFMGPPSCAYRCDVIGSPLLGEEQGPDRAYRPTAHQRNHVTRGMDNWHHWTVHVRVGSSYPALSGKQAIYWQCQ